jgi:hypothetical protein
VSAHHRIAVVVYGTYNLILPRANLRSNGIEPLGPEWSKIAYSYIRKNKSFLFGLGIELVSTTRICCRQYHLSITFYLYQILAIVEVHIVILYWSLFVWVRSSDCTIEMRATLYLFRFENTMVKSVTQKMYAYSNTNLLGLCSIAF